MKKFIVCTILYLCAVNICFGFDDKDTHPLMTGKAVASIQTSIDSILKNNLGINGMSQQFKNSTIDGAQAGKTKSVLEWLKAGSTDEDREPSTCRASNHFHNPLASTWSAAGLWGYQGPMASGVDAYCANTAPSWNSKLSNVVWATNITSPDGAYNASTINSDNWERTRGYYLNALTDASKTSRDSNFAKTFYGLGHVLHLLQDMAVPAHVRNDFRSHLDNFVNIGFSLPTYWTKNDFENYVEQHDSKITTANPVTFQHLTDFWDTGQYRTNVNPSMMNIQAGGLAEYTNANFASDYTIFTERYPLDSPYRFPYPSQSNTTVYLEDRPYLDKLGRPVYRVYLGKTGNGETIQHFATAGRLFFKKYIPNEPVVIEDPVAYLGFDDKCHSDYASLLIPRAVGYSAGLLNYFFRGEMDMKPDPQTSGNFIIENYSSETMEGTFTLYYDDKDGNRNKVSLNMPNLKISGGSQDNPGKSISVSFIEPNYPEPKEKGKYILVFKGTLGSEKDAIVGKVVNAINPTYSITIKAINEPLLIGGYSWIEGQYWIGNWSLIAESMLTGVKDTVTLEISIRESSGSASLVKDVILSVEPFYYGRPGSGTLGATAVRTDSTGKARVVFRKGDERTGYTGFYSGKPVPEWKAVIITASLVDDKNITSSVGLGYRDPISISMKSYGYPTSICNYDDKGGMEVLIWSQSWTESLNTINLPSKSGYCSGYTYLTITFGDGTSRNLDGAW